MSFHDPRSRGFRSRSSVDFVLDAIRARVKTLGAESVGLCDASGRVLARDVTASIDVPGFDRAAMDGFALRGVETFGADVYQPAFFRRVGRSRPGRPCATVVGSGDAVEIATGAPLPEGADTVVKVESTYFKEDVLHVFEPTPPGRHVGRRGEDVAAGAVILKAGRVLRPQDLGLLSAIGASSIEVVRRPRVSIVITGDELMPPGEPAREYRIADANSPMLAALTIRDGGLASVVGPAADARDVLREILLRKAEDSDVILVSGGSSAGPEDHAPGLVDELGELVAHGVAIRPASPTGFGSVRGAHVVLLPGNPVSCLCAYDFFAGPIIRILACRSEEMPYPKIRLPLSTKLSSVIGRVDYARVRVVDGFAEPITVGGASILSSATRADGFVVVPDDLEGYPPGEEVVVRLYDAHPP